MPVRGLLPPTVPCVEAVQLTSLARAGGCAAKYAAARLETLLQGFVPAEEENLLVGLDPADDAAVYRLDDERALVFTVDFFPPLVDDPRAFGAIAATNALNDVFAMGGAPLLALSVAAFPEELPTEVLGDVLSGAEERVRASGAILAGGHTIRDDEPKYGLAVVGTVHPDGVWPKAGARAGDALFLTKPLGTGIVLQAARDGAAPAGALEAAIESMVELNRSAAETLRPFSPSAVTDVTGFGLLGHVHELASRSGVRAVLDSESPAALEELRRALGRPSVERRDAVAAVVARHPRFLDAWARLGDLARDVVHDARFEAEAAGRAVVVQGGGPYCVRGNPALLRSAIDNVVRNAVRHTPAESTVTVVLEPVEDQRVAIVVRDQGSGVPADALPRLFEPFFRVDESRDRSSGGTGLGLAIVYQAMLAHGGSAIAENHPDGGLAVRLELPLER